MPERKVYCEDALEWLLKNKKNPCIITSLPEMEEMKMKIKEYESFFRHSAHLCLDSVNDSGYCIFLQTDRKHHGWVDKGYWITDEAYKLGYHTVWKKIVITKDVGKTDLFRPTYSTMLCFTKDGKVGKPIPDVIEGGEKTYTHGFGVNAVNLCCKYVKEAGIKKVVDPFCGSGTTLAIANNLGLSAIGVEIDKRLCEIALKLKITTKSPQD
jgi:hypothetical protein